MIITLANWKGGVGKTTLSYHIAYHLAEQGEPVVAVDLDPQGNLTYAMTGGFSSGVVDFFLHSRPAGQCVVEIAPNLHLLGSSEETGALRKWDKGYNTLCRLRTMVPRTVWVIVDTSPAHAITSTGEIMDPINASALYHSDGVLCPVQPEQLSLVGLASLVNSISVLRRHSARPALMGIVPTMVDVRNSEHPTLLREMVKLYRHLVWPPVPDAIDIARPARRGEPVFSFAPSGKAAVQLRAIGERVRTWPETFQSQRT